MLSYAANQCLVNRVNALIAVDLDQFMLISIIIGERQRLVEEDIQALLNSLWPIIGTLIQFTTINIADARYFRRSGINVIHVLLSATDIATGESPQQHLLRNGEVSRDIDVPIHTRQTFVQCPRLRHRAWEAIKEDARVTVGLRDARQYHMYRNIVGNQVAAINIGFCPPAQFALLLNSPAKQVATGDMADAKRLRQHPRLSSLP